MLIEQDSCFPGPKNRHVLETDMITAVLPGIRAYYFFLSKVRLQDCEIYVLQSRHFWLEIPLEKKIIREKNGQRMCFIKSNKAFKWFWLCTCSILYTKIVFFLSVFCLLSLDVKIFLDESKTSKTPRFMIYWNVNLFD